MFKLSSFVTVVIIFNTSIACGWTRGKTNILPIVDDIGILTVSKLWDVWNRIPIAWLQVAATFNWWLRFFTLFIRKFHLSLSKCEINTALHFTHLNTMTTRGTAWGPWLRNKPENKSQHKNLALYLNYKHFPYLPKTYERKSKPLLA